MEITRTGRHNLRTVLKAKHLVLLACLMFVSMDAWAEKTSATQVLVSRMANGDSQSNPNIEILQLIANRLGAELKLVHAPFKRALIMMKTGDMDMLAGLLRNPERETDIFYIQPPYKTRSDTVFFVPKGKAGQIVEYENLFWLKIGATIGAHYFPRFDQDRLLSKELVADGRMSFRKLLAGRIDTVVSSESDGIDLADKMGIASRVETATFRFSQEKNVYIGLSKASEISKRIPGIEQTIRAMIQSGEILQVFEKYYTSRNLPIPAF